MNALLNSVTDLDSACDAISNLPFDDEVMIVIGIVEKARTILIRTEMYELLAGVLNYYIRTKPDGTGWTVDEERAVYVLKTINVPYYQELVEFVTNDTDYTMWYEPSVSILLQAYPQIDRKQLALVAIETENEIVQHLLGQEDV